MKSNFIYIISVLLLLSCAEPQARRPVAQKTATVLSETIQQKKELIASENKFIEGYLAKDSVNTYKTSPFGFWYTYISKIENDARSPKIGDKIELEYTITDLNNVVIYTKEELGVKNYIIDKEDFIPGLQEGVKLMKVGETITFVIPSYRAFGLVGDANKIGINQTIKSTVTLLKIKE